MFFVVNTPEGNVAVPEGTFFAAVKRHVVHGDPCAEYRGYIAPEGPLAGVSWTAGAPEAVVTAADCAARMSEMMEEAGLPRQARLSAWWLLTPDMIRGTLSRSPGIQFAQARRPEREFHVTQSSIPSAAVK